jgi:hypothetical protein
VPAALTELTEIVTGLGTLAPDLTGALARRPAALRHVPDDVWDRLVTLHARGDHAAAFAMAFANGTALLWAEDGLRHRPPRLVEWRGQHRVPGDDHVPADLRIDHVYLVSCKYLSRILVNCGPSRLFDRCLVGEDRSRVDWFEEVAPDAYGAFYDAVRTRVADELPDLPGRPGDLATADRARLRTALADRRLPEPLQSAWRDLSAEVAAASAARWSAAIGHGRGALRQLWRLLRVGDAAYFVLGADRDRHVRLRVSSAWDWSQHYELAAFEVRPRDAGQPEVGWTATVVDRAVGMPVEVRGHVQVRWSHGRFGGAPEAKVYLDVPLRSVPGYHDLR